MRLDVKAMKKLVVSLLLVFSDALLWGQGQSSPVQPATKAVSAQAFEHLSVDTPKTTVLGNAFVAPKGWSIRVKGPATILEAPEGDSWVALVLGRLLPKGYSRESFAGKKANTLDQARIAELGRFVELGQKVLGVPGVALGLVQDGKGVFADGFGIKELGGTEKPDGDTLFMVASNTKAMTTLL